MRRLRQVKIVATLGPKSCEYGIIRDLFLAGADVFRLNMSHGCQDEVRKMHAAIRRVELETARPIGILVDLQGPKIRCGIFEKDSVEIIAGELFRFDLEPIPGDSRRVCLPHKEIFDALSPGHKLLVNDGKIRLSVESCGSEFADCRVEVGGQVSNRKGVNLPDSNVALSAISEKDREDLEFACGLGIDWIGLSFIQNGDDVAEGRRLARGRAAILSKIEKPAAVAAFGDILEASDSIMVARGDLGVELPVQNVPPIQKRLIASCRAAAKPVIVATQMLESMVFSPSPTRAEVSDVATAIYEGADAVMLSAESAAGEYPVESVGTMNDIAVEIESDPAYREAVETSRCVTRTTIADAITAAAREVAENTDVRALCCFTHSGTTVALVARERPRVPTVAMTPFEKIARRLSLTWGSHCIVVDSIVDFEDAVAKASNIARTENFAEPEDQIVIITGMPFNVAGTTNIVRVAPVS
ncbi:MAG: pyruvate kinase [Albidovulum sp.]|nr:pyruvate kinase [Albidovulum sp.]MDE0307234.1 pyruvate kinase [Albidovulum sp.]MDE0531962.1 pyruvate kinase [Albidovulum sp.]